MTSPIFKYLIATTAGFATLAAASIASAQDLKPFKVLTANNTACSIFAQHVAEELGFYKDEGLDVELLASATTVPYIAFLQNGDADIVMLDSAQVLQMANEGIAASVVYEAYQFAPEGIVVVKDSPVRGLGELKGKIIGLASDRDVITTTIALESVGLKIDDVTTVVVGDSGPVMAKALRDKTIDAFAGGQSDRAGIEAAGIEIRNITPPEVNENPANSFAVWNATKEEKRPQIEGFLRAWAKAQLAAVVNTKIVKSVCRKVVPEQWEDEASGHKLLDQSIYITQLSRTKNFGELQPDVWSRIQPTLVRLGEAPAEIDPAKFLDDSFIAGANDFTTAEVKEGLIKWRDANQAAMLP